MLQKHFLVLIIFTLMVLGCASTETIESTKVSPTEIYRSYAVRGNKDGFNSTVVFRVGGSSGTTIDLDAPAKIEHNGKEMNESKPNFIKGTDYFDSASKYSALHKFSFTDNEGKIWNDEISLEPVEITSPKNSFSLKTGGIIELSRPLQENERPEFSIVSDTPAPPDSENEENIAGNIKVNKVTYSTIFQGELADNRQTVTVKAHSFNKFKTGEATLSVTVRKTENLTKGGKGCSISVIYESQNVAANVLN